MAAQSVADLVAVLESGLIKEDLLDRIVNVDQQELVFTNSTGTSSHSAPEFSWVMDRYAPQALDNAWYDGQPVDQEDNTEGQRVYNHTQTSGKEVKVTIGGCGG